MLKKAALASLLLSCFSAMAVPTTAVNLSYYKLSESEGWVGNTNYLSPMTEAVADTLASLDKTKNYVCQAKAHKVDLVPSATEEHDILNIYSLSDCIEQECN